MMILSIMDNHSFDLLPQDKRQNAAVLEVGDFNIGLQVTPHLE
jgi:hypothetical protein